jgi:DNA mismatch repair ATPase MutS
LEKESFRSERLKRLRQELETGGLPPSRRIRRLARLVELLHARRNQLFLPVSLLLLWGTQMAFTIEAWRRTCGGAVGRWLEAVGELEALCALAGYAFEHPEDPFPEIVEDGPCLVGRSLGHPLLPGDASVRNDVRLDQQVRLLVVSGSNMSGKSTLLRTVGINACLAQAGAPVRAAGLRLSPLSIGATIRILDSLREGSSRFYTEISRIRRIVDLAGGDRGLLFLLDEILHGTNSHDRAIGAEAIVRGLLDRNAVGLITTHDLALARVAEELSPRAENVHFEDRLEDGNLVFDYILRPGVVRRSNALELLRSVGLDV